MLPKRSSLSRNQRLTLIIAVLAIVATIIAAFVSGHDWFSPATTPASSDPVSDYYPLFLGGVRTYTVGRSTPNTDGTIGLTEEVSSYSEQIIRVVTSIDDSVHTYEIKQSSGAFDIDCSGDLPTTTETTIWYVTTATKLYIACNDKQKGEILSDIASQPPKYIFPLKLNAHWDAFLDSVPRNDTMYSWYVEAETNVDTAAGSFEDCFKIRLETLPDTSYKYICKGVGLVAIEYHHHGSPVNYRVELKSYTK